MKRIVFGWACFMVLTQGFAQPDSTINSTDKSLKEQVLKDIEENLNQKTLALDSTITQLDQKVSYLDNSIKATKNASVKVDKLLERVKALEEIQSTLEQNELN